MPPREDVERLYVSRRGRGRGLASIEDSVDASRQLENYMEKRGKSVITVTRNNTNGTRTIGATINRRQKWEEK